jgi:hypothetical protein
MDVPGSALARVIRFSNSWACHLGYRGQSVRLDETVPDSPQQLDALGNGEFVNV